MVVLIIGGVVVLILGLLAVLASLAFVGARNRAEGLGVPERSADGAVTTEGLLPLTELQVGDCLEWPGDTETGILDPVAQVMPCGGPHPLEVYFETTLPEPVDAPFPGDAEVSERASDLCFQAFEPFVGLPYDQSELDYSYFYPTFFTWTKQEDREVTCLVLPFDETLVTGSLEASQR